MSSVQQLFPTGSYGSVSATNGVVTGAETVGSLILPTNGGTATPLTYYEEYTDPAFGWNFAAGYTPTSTTVVLSLVRIGRLVVMHLPTTDTQANAGGGTPSTFVSSSTIPSRFCPAASNTYVGVFPAPTTPFTGTLVVNNGGVTGQLMMGQGLIPGTNWSGTANAFFGCRQDTCFFWSV